MKNYRWKNATTSGHIQASSKEHAKVKLGMQNIFPEKIWRDYQISWLNYKTSKELESFFLQQLLLILQASIPIERAIGILSQQDNQSFKYLANKVLNFIQSGLSLSAALEKSTKLPKHFISMLSLSEQQGTLVKTLEKICQRIDAKKQIQSQISKAIFYPTMLLFTCAAVCFIMIHFLLPSLQGFYQSNHAQLPSSTQFLLSLSSLSAIQIIFPPLLLFLIALSLYKISRQNGYHLLSDRLLFYLPKIGKILFYYQILSIFSLLDESLSAGITLHEAWIKSIAAVNSVSLKEKMQIVSKQLESGKSLYHALVEVAFLPSLAMNLFLIAEDTGQYPHIMNKLVGIYEKIFQEILYKTLRWMEPILLFISTGVIGFIVISVYSPLFNMGNVM